MFESENKILKQLQCQSCMNCENGYAYLIFFQHFFGFLLPLTSIFVLQLITMSLKKTSKEGLVVSFMKSSTIAGTTTNSTGEMQSSLLEETASFERDFSRRQRNTLLSNQQPSVEVGDFSLFNGIVSPRQTMSIAQVNRNPNRDSHTLTEVDLRENLDNSGRSAAFGFSNTGSVAIEVESSNQNSIGKNTQVLTEKPSHYIDSFHKSS